MAQRENKAADEKAKSCCEDQSNGAADAESESCCERHKNTPRSQEMQADLTKRLNRAIGQLNGVKGMIDDNRYCGDVLIQLAAVKSAVCSIERIVLENHLQTCVVEEVRKGNDEIIAEAMDLIRRVAK